MAVGRVAKYWNARPSEILGIIDFATAYDIDQGIALVLMMEESRLIEEAEEKSRKQAQSDLAKSKNKDGGRTIITETDW